MLANIAELQAVEVFRIIPRRIKLFEVNPLKSFADIGRFHQLGDPATSYLSCRTETAIFEVSSIREVMPERDRLTRYRVNLTESIDLCSNTVRNILELTLDQLHGPKVSGDPAHELRLCVAREARRAGYQGLWYPSFADRPSGVNLVLFLENAYGGHLTEGAAIESIDEDDNPGNSRLVQALDVIRTRYGLNWVEEIRRQTRG